ncbi:hypothetical protein ALQ18_200024 [Pseudomonas marginalis pv. marginalis]|nr:hypothetical protein ALQ18_200024 [Pseudomonas marginalis pv. marginalis]
MSAFSYAGAIFPQHESCTVGKDKANDCDVELDGNGFLIDGASGQKVSIISENTGMMSSNWLYKYGNKYVLEHLDFSSSQARQWVIFDYINKKIVVDKVYSFSQEISPQSVPSWHGYECRGSGDSLKDDKNVAFSELVVAAFCGDATHDQLKVKAGTPNSLMGVSLNLGIPVYSNKKKNGEAFYLFFDTDKPDLFQMACYSNCSLSSEGHIKTYIGRVSKSAWFINKINESGCKSSGEYRYKASEQKILLSGCVGNGQMNLTERLPGKDSDRATFLGIADADGYRGEWISKSGDSKKYDFFMYPLTVY